MLVYAYATLPGRPRGVEHANTGERRMNSNSIASHATPILEYHASMLTLQKQHFGCHRCDTPEFGVYILTMDKHTCRRGKAMEAKRRSSINQCAGMKGMVQ